MLSKVFKLFVSFIFIVVGYFFHALILALPFIYPIDNIIYTI